jgi:hypothetical protein
MPGIEDNVMWVYDDAVIDDYADDELEIEVDEEFDDDDIDVVVIDEDDVEQECDMPVVVEEIKTIPGSDKAEDGDEPEPEAKPKDWENDNDHAQFVSYVKDKLTKIPRHSGETVPGCERAKAFLQSIDSEISKAMRSDLSGVIDEQEIDGVRKSIDDMIERLDKQIKKLRPNKKAAYDVKLFAQGTCEKCQTSAPMWHDTASDKLVCMHCEAERGTDVIEKTAGTPVLNVYMSPFERAIVGTMINSTVSGGKNIEETYMKLKNKYNFTPREELAIQQLVADYGYPVNKDRGLLNEPSDPAAGDGVEWQTNYNS